MEVMIPNKVARTFFMAHGVHIRLLHRMTERICTRSKYK